MELNYFDFLSPEITFFFFGKCRHSSSIGGILTLFMILLWVYYIFYILIANVPHKSPSIHFHRKYSKSGIKLSFSNTEIFHYFEFYNYNGKNSSYYNPKYIRIFMVSFISEYETFLLEKKDHWLYDNCEENDIPLNNEEYINDLVNFTQGACLKYYYNSKLKKYFPVNDTDNFISPNLITDNLKNNYYNLMTVIEKCNKNSISSEILGDCADENEIENYLKKYNFTFLNILNHQIDAYNYSSPNNSYIHKIISSLNINNTIINNINFYPLEIKKQSGFLPYSTYEKTYILEENIKTINNEKIDNYVLGAYNYLLKNNVQTFELIYKNFYFDILPSIGGSVQLIYNIFFLLNLIFNKINIVHDTQNLIFQCDRIKERARSHQVKFTSIVKSLQLNNSHLYTNTNSQNVFKPSEIVQMRHQSIMDCNEENLKKSRQKNNSIDKKNYFDINKITNKKYSHPSYKSDNNRFANIEEYDKTKDQLLTELNCMQLNNINQKKKRTTFQKTKSEINMFKNTYLEEIKKKKPIVFTDLIHKKKISNLALNDTLLNKNNENNNDKSPSTHLSLKKPNKKSTFYPHNYGVEKPKMDVISLPKFSERKQKEVNKTKRFSKSVTNIGKIPLSNQKLKSWLKKKKDKKRKVNIIKPNCKTAKEQHLAESIQQIENKNKKKNVFNTLIYVSKIRLSNHKFTLCDYLKSFFDKKDKHDAIYIFEQFRKKLLSEEHNFRTSIFLCLNEKILVEPKRKIDLNELYDNL